MTERENDPVDPGPQALNGAVSADQGSSNSTEPARPSFGLAVSWSYALTGGRTVVTLIVSLVLARLLGPEVFGAVAMANVLVLFIEMFVRQGLVAAIVQRPNLTRLHLDTAFWMTAGAVGLLTPLTIAVSGWWANVNALPELRWLIIGLAPMLVFKGLGVVQEAQIRRNMDFRALAVRTNVAVLIGGAVGLGTAFGGAGVWALVAQQLTTAAIELVMIWRLSSWRPRMRYERECAGQLFSFTGRTLLAALGNFVNIRSDALLIGLFFGPVAVGLYRMAVRFISLSLEITVDALQSVFLPELSRSNGDQESFNRRTVVIVRYGAILAIPLLGALAAASDPLMMLLGEEWAPAAPALRLLCILAAVQAIALFVAPILQAAGRPGVHAWLTWISAVLSAGSFTASGLLLTEYDVATQVAWLAGIRVAVFAPTLFVIVLPVLKRTLGLAPTLIVRAIWPSGAAALLGFLSVFGLREAIGSAWLSPPPVGIAATGLLAAAVAAGSLALTDPVARSFPGLLLRKVRAR